jgi:hypothetical protein
MIRCSRGSIWIIFPLSKISIDFKTMLEAADSWNVDAGSHFHVYDFELGSFGEILPNRSMVLLLKVDFPLGES